MNNNNAQVVKRKLFSSPFISNSWKNNKKKILKSKRKFVNSEENILLRRRKFVFASFDSFAVLKLSANKILSEQKT